MLPPTQIASQWNFWQGQVTKFAAAYADQTESDHRELRKAVRDGRLEAATV